jgi:hypothetical protein
MTTRLRRPLLKKQSDTDSTATSTLPEEAEAAAGEEQQKFAPERKTIARMQMQQSNSSESDELSELSDAGYAEIQYSTVNTHLQNYRYAILYPISHSVATVTPQKDNQRRDASLVVTYSYLADLRARRKDGSTSWLILSQPIPISLVKIPLKIAPSQLKIYSRRLFAQLRVQFASTPSFI